MKVFVNAEIISGHRMNCKRVFIPNGYRLKVMRGYSNASLQIFTAALVQGMILNDQTLSCSSSQIWFLYSSWMSLNHQCWGSLHWLGARVWRSPTWPTDPKAQPVLVDVRFSQSNFQYDSPELWIHLAFKCTRTLGMWPRQSRIWWGWDSACRDDLATLQVGTSPDPPRTPVKGQF